MKYIPLHVHTWYSQLDGLSSPKEYVERAKELEIPYLAITDHETLVGHREFQKACEENGITPILGLEGYVSETDRFDRRSRDSREDGTSVYNHITMLAKNKNGLENLNRMSETAWTEGFYYKPRIDTALLETHKQDMIILSGCMSGLVADAILNEDTEKAERWAVQYKEILGDDYYIEVMSSNEPSLNHELLRIADKFDIKPAMTGDCHYAKPEDLWLEEAMLILGSKPKKNFKASLTEAKKMEILDRYDYLWPDRRMTFRQIEIYMRDGKTEFEKFSAQGIDRTDIYENTLEVASKIGEYPYFEGLDLLPNPENIDPNKSLRAKVMAGARKRGIDGDATYLARIEEELSVITDKDFSTYFLIVEDAVTWAKDNGVMVGPGRGSAAGSLVCYCLGITEVDPIEYGLLFMRFLDKNRADAPDIDVDFADHGRERVKEYVRNRYGHVASIATFGMFKGKSSIKDAARALGIPSAEANKATKNFPDDASSDHFFEKFRSSEQGAIFMKNHPEVVPLAKGLQGRLRNRGVHAAGLVLSKEPLEKYVPIETGTNPADKEGPRIKYVACDMNTAADIGLIKMDFLGLVTLSIIQDTLYEIAKRTGKRINILEIDKEDKNVYDMLSKGYTAGVFQCEAVPYTNLILKMGGVRSFDELVASNALVRPGAMNSIGGEYIDAKNGVADISYPHADMKKFTENTYSKIIYQEQVMLTITEIAGMSMGDANKIRKIIGKKKDVTELEKYRQEFIDGASQKISKATAEKLWQDFEAHADYSFNASHAVAYSMLSYQTAWLKHHYPLEFMASVLKNTDSKGSKKDSITDYLIEAKRLGIKILLPSVNKSKAEVSIDGDAIRLGLSDIKNIGVRASAAIIKHRPYSSYEDLVTKASKSKSGIGKRIIESLNKVGAATFSDNPKRGDERDNFYEYLKIPAFEQKSLEPIVKHKFVPLDEYSENSVFPILAMVRGMKIGEGWARVEVVDETGSAGIFADEKIPIETGQMYAILVASNRVARFMTLEELYGRVDTPFSKYLYEDFPDIDEDKYQVISFRRHVTKAGKEMAYMAVMDHLNNLIPVMVFPSQYRMARVHCMEGQSVKLQLKETKDGAVFVDGFK